MLKPAAAQSKEVSAVGKGLRSGQGAIRQFWNPIKPDKVPAEIPKKKGKVPAETMLKPAAAQSKEVLAVGKGLRSGQGASRQFWNPMKPDKVPVESAAAVQSKDVSGVGKGLRSGQGAIRQFWNPIKPDKVPAEIP